ncbi:YunG family protein [Dongia soli]
MANASSPRSCCTTIRRRDIEAACDGDHSYNGIGGTRIDLATSQFDAPTAFADIAGSRDGALAGTAEENYAALNMEYSSR